MMTEDSTILDEGYLATRRQTLIDRDNRDSPCRVRVLCVDYHFDYGIVTLITQATGTSFLLHSNCNRSQQHKERDTAHEKQIVALHETAEKHLSLFKKEEGDSFAFPSVGRLSLRAVSDDGIFCLYGNLKKKCKSHAERELFEALNSVLLHQLSFRENYFGNRDLFPKATTTTKDIRYFTPALIAPTFAVFRAHTKTVRVRRELSLGDIILSVIKPAGRQYHSYRHTILTLSPPESTASLVDTIAHAAIVEVKGRSGAEMTVLRISGTVDHLRESHRPAMGLDLGRQNVTRAVRAFLREATASLSYFSKEELGTHPLPSDGETMIRLVTNRGIYCYCCPNEHPERCPKEILQAVNLYFNLIDTL